MKKLAAIICSAIIATGFSGEVMGQVTSSDAWINEFHYDNEGTDTLEFVEVVIKNVGDYNLSDFTVTRYNGNNGASYGSDDLSTFVEGDTEGDYTFYYFTYLVNGLQNGPDGFTLSHNGDLIQFLSYEGTFEATDGPALEEASVDVGVSESGGVTAPVGHSLQLTGAGYTYDEFTWTGPSEDSPGSMNEGQFLFPTVQFTAAGATVNEADGSVTIEVEILNPDGNAIDVDVVFQQNPSTAEASDLTTSTTQTVSFGTEAIDSETKNASFTIENDSSYEGAETAQFILSNISTIGAAQISGQTTYALTIEDDDTPNVVINEFLADPGGIDIDGNGSTNGTSDDEFVEFYNLESTYVDISGWKYSDDGTAIKYTFPEGSIIQANSAIVLFSKDSDGEPIGLFGGSVIKTSDLVLSLNNPGDNPTLLDSEDNIIDSHTYESSTAGVSMVRVPEGTGDFFNHNADTVGASSDYSPGTKSDGSLFTTALVIEGSAGWRMLSAPVENMPISEITDDTPIQGFDDGQQINFYTGYDGAGFTSPANLSGNLNSGEGFILYFYNNENAGSSTLPVVIDVGLTSEPGADVTVNLHSDGNKWNLLGNPFQTAFDMNSLVESGGTEGLVSKVGQVWSDKDESYVLTSSNEDKIAPGQGFFIENNDAVSVTFPLSGKTTGTTFYKSNHQKAFVQLELISEGVNGTGAQKDLSAMLYFHDDASSNWDRWDTGKLYPLKGSYSLLNIISVEDEKVKAQDSRSYDSEEEIFHLDVESYNVKPNQTLKWSKESDIPENWEFIFIDNQAGLELPMDEDFNYSFVQKDIYYPAQYEIMTKKAIKMDVHSEEKAPRFTIIVKKSRSVATENRIPLKYALEQNYPNPFNPVTTIKYSIPAIGLTTLDVFTITGQKVATLVNEVKSEGTYQLQWDAEGMASGIYYYRLKANGKVITRKMTLIK